MFCRFNCLDRGGEILFSCVTAVCKSQVIQSPLWAHPLARGDRQPQADRPCVSIQWSEVIIHLHGLKFNVSGIDFVNKTFEIEGAKVQLQIW